MTKEQPDREKLLAAAHAAINRFIAKSNTTEVALGTLFEKIDQRPVQTWVSGWTALRACRAKVCKPAIDHALDLRVSPETTKSAMDAAEQILLAIPGADYDGHRPVQSARTLIGAINRALAAEMSPSVG